MPTAKLLQNSLLLTVQAVNNLYSVIDPDTDITVLAINRPVNITGALTVSGAINGTASAALKLATGRTIGVSGDLSYTSPSFDGTANVTAAATLATVNSAPVAASFSKLTTNTKGLTTATTPVVAADITALVNSVYVSKSGDTMTGSLTATGFIGPLTGNASTATTLATARVISATGDAAGAAPAFDGSIAVALPLTLATVNATPVSNAFVKITNNAKGLVTSTAAVTAADLTPLLNTNYVQKTGDTMTGALGIGVTPTGAYKLQVSGGLSAQSSTASFPVTFTKTDSGTASQNGTLNTFVNLHASNTGRAADIYSGKVLFQFSQPTSGAAQDAGYILVAADGTQSGPNTQSYMAFGTTNLSASSSTEKMRIDNAGNVGVGTSLPTARLSSYVSDAATNTSVNVFDIAHSSSGTVAAGFGVSQRTVLQDAGGNLIQTALIKSEWVNSAVATRSTLFSIFTSNNNQSTQALVIDGLGNVGIGTSSPIAAGVQIYGRDLYVYNGNNSVGGGGAVNFGVSAIGSSWSPMSQIKGLLDFAYSGTTELQGGLAFLTRPVNTGASQALTERMRIDSAGNVVIGNNVASRKLDVYGDAGIGIHPSSDNTVATISTSSTTGATTFDLFTSLANTGAAFIIRSSTTSGASTTEKFRIDSAGNVFVGTTNSTNVNVQVGSTSAASNFLGVNSSGSGKSYLVANSNNFSSISLLTNNTGSTTFEGIPTGTVGIATYPNTVAPMVFATNGAERMRIDVNGSLLIGTPTAATFGHGGSVQLARLHNAGTAGNSQCQLIFSSGITAAGSSALGGVTWALPNISTGSGGMMGYIGGVTAPAHTATTPALDIAFATRSATDSASGAAIVRMTLDSTGNLLLGTTSSNAPTGGTFIRAPGVAGSSSIFLAHANGTPTNNSYSEFFYNGTQIGTISQNGTTGVTFNTTSDYRLKVITGPVTESGKFIDALKPSQGSWKEDGSAFVGFVAHEFQEVSPSSVTGVKDAVDDDEKPIYQAMQASSPEVMANLVAEVQTLRKRNAFLEYQMALVLAKLGISA